MAFSLMLAVAASLTWGAMAQAAPGAGQNLCIANHGTVRVQIGSATCYADATSHVKVIGAGSHAEGRDGSRITVSGDNTSVMMGGSTVTVNGDDNTVGGNSSNVTIDGDVNQVVTFYSTVDISGSDNRVIDAVLSTVSVAGNANLLTAINTCTLDVTANGSTIVGCPAP
jgi:hypothetical protein